jgi:hypothetical protein
VITFGNTAPVVELTTSPAPGEPFQFGQQVTFQVTVTDDSPVDCSTVTVGYTDTPEDPDIPPLTGQRRGRARPQPLGHR